MNIFNNYKNLKAKRLAQSLFDRNFYGTHYTDVVADGQDLFVHYLHNGWKEGRDPSPNFSTLYYKDKYMRGDDAKTNPLIHYCKLSRITREGRGASAGSDFPSIQASIIADGFDTTYYCRIARLSSDIDPIAHYLTEGWRQGLAPNRWFQAEQHLRAHWYIDTSVTNPFYHYMTTRRTLAPNEAGLVEQSDKDDSNDTSTLSINYTGLPIDEIYKVLSKHFDREYYLRVYADVRKANIDPIVHFISHGAQENRNPNDHFITSYYKSKYSKEISSQNPFYHYITEGIQLGLKPYPHGYDISPNSGSTENFLDVEAAGGVDIDVYEVVSKRFDAAYYTKTYADVRDAGMDPVTHFLEHGWKEGRDPSELFSASYYRKRYARKIGSRNPFYHYLTEGEAQGLKPNPYGYTAWPAATTPTDREWCEIAAATDLNGCEIALIMPVYKGYSDTLRSIHSVLAAANTTRHALIVIDDASPDADLSRELERLAAEGYFLLLQNAQNLGFVRTVNRGLAYAPDKDVVLLNADITVFGDWLDRMVRHAKADPQIATITPFSNNATICSYPVANRDNTIQLEVDAATLDRYTSLCNAGGCTDVPTGVGFCFYMRRAVIDEIGPLDPETFGKGYGEENDFCMRAIRKGYRNVVAHDIFVHHSGSVSFGDVQSSKWTSIRDAILSKHPDYFSRIQIHVQTDPVRDARSRLDLYRLAALIGTEPAIFITHPMGGGIETHVQQLSAKFVAEGRNVLIFRISRPDILTIDLPDGTAIDFSTEILRPISLSKNADMLADFIGWLKPHSVHVHSFANLSWRATKTLMALVPTWSPLYYLTLHDYEFACHRYNLIKPDSTFCGLAHPAECRICIATDKEVQAPPDPEERRDAFRDFADGATRVFSPSRDTALRAETILSSTGIVVRPHEDRRNPIEWSHEPKPGETLRIAVIGAIGPHKGAYVLHALAQDAMTRNLDISFTIIGYSHDHLFMTSVGIRQTGKYSNEEEALELLRDGNFDFIFLPSIFPETYCYALSMAIQSGIPTLSFDIGAQAERLGAIDPSCLIDYSLRNDPQALNDRLIEQAAAKPLTYDRDRTPIIYASIEAYYGAEASKADASHPAMSSRDKPQARDNQFD